MEEMHPHRSNDGRKTAPDFVSASREWNVDVAYRHADLPFAAPSGRNVGHCPTSCRSGVWGFLDDNSGVKHERGASHG